MALTRAARGGAVPSVYITETTKSSEGASSPHDIYRK